MKPDQDTVLRKALEELSPAGLVNILMKFITEDTEDEDFRRKLMEVVTVPTHLILQQPVNSSLVIQLKKTITRFFDRLDEHLSPYYEDDLIPELDDFLNDIQTLNPKDQLEVLPHLLKVTNAALDENGINTSQLDQAIEMYGQAASTLNLSDSEKEAHFDQMLAWLDELGIWEYGADRTAIKAGLDVLIGSEEDYVFVIKRLNQYLNTPALEEAHYELRDWLAAYYLRVGDEKNYLKVREDNLDTEARFYELATYWLNKDQLQRYVETLENWLAFLNKGRSEGGHRGYYYSSDYQRSYSAVLGERVKHGLILEKLASYYRDTKKLADQLRILLAQAQYLSASFDLYREIKPLASGLGRWEEVRPKFQEFVGGDDKTLAQIHLYEEEWEAALIIAEDQHRYGYGVIDLVGQGVKNIYPQRAIKLYEKLVSENIAEADRKHYQFAAEYATKIKDIYLTVLKDSVSWQNYIAQIRVENRRRPALQDEFKAL